MYTKHTKIAQQANFQEKNKQKLTSSGGSPNVGQSQISEKSLACNKRKLC